MKAWVIAKGLEFLIPLQGDENFEEAKECYGRAKEAREKEMFGIVWKRKNKEEGREMLTLVCKGFHARDSPDVEMGEVAAATGSGRAKFGGRTAASRREKRAGHAQKFLFVTNAPHKEE